MEVVWIHICYPLEFVENDYGKWEWKNVGKGKKKNEGNHDSQEHIICRILHKVVQELQIDTTVKELEMQCIVPVMSNFPSAPLMVIDSDNSVKWLVSFCERTFVGISLIDKDNRNEETHAFGNNYGNMARENRGYDGFSSKAVSNEMLNKDMPISKGVKNVDNLERPNMGKNGFKSAALSDELLNNQTPVENVDNLERPNMGNNGFKSIDELLNNQTSMENVDNLEEVMSDDVGIEVRSDDIYMSVDPLLSFLCPDGAGDVSLEAFNETYNVNVERLSNEETETHNMNGVEGNNVVELSTPNQNSVPVILNVSDAGIIVPPARIPESEDIHKHDIFESNSY